MGKRPGIFGFSLLALGLMVAAGGLWLAQDAVLRRTVARFLLLGGPLLEFRAPEAGQLMPMGSVEVIVAFSSSDRVAPETFRCLLNDQDVTRHLTLGRNGAGGSLHGLLEGENRLRVEVFGRGWWPGRFLEDARELTFHVRPLPTLDRAGLPGMLDSASSGLSLPSAAGAPLSARTKRVFLSVGVGAACRK